MNALLERDSVSAAVMRLKEGDRKVLVLYYYQELSVREISAVIGKTENAVMQRLNRARGNMKKMLEEIGYERG